MTDTQNGNRKKIQAPSLEEFKTLPLEESFARLDALIEALERPECTLEEAFALYQTGMTLLGHCNETIDLVEKQVMAISEDGEEVAF